VARQAFYVNKTLQYAKTEKGELLSERVMGQIILDKMAFGMSHGENK
jgi:hypothetical protein